MDIQKWTRSLKEINWAEESIQEFMEKVISEGSQLKINYLQKAVDLGWDINKYGNYYDDTNISSEDPQYFFKDGLCTPFMAICRNTDIYNNIINTSNFFSGNKDTAKCYNNHNDYFDMTLMEILFLSNSNLHCSFIEDITYNIGIQRVVDLDKIDRYVQFANIEKIMNEYTHLWVENNGIEKYISDIVKDINERKYEEFHRGYTIQYIRDENRNYVQHDVPEYNYYISSRGGFDAQTMDKYFNNPDVYRASKEELIEIIESNGYTLDEDLDRTDLQDIINENSWDKRLVCSIITESDADFHHEFDSRGILIGEQYLYDGENHIHEWRINGVLHNETGYAYTSHGKNGNIKEFWLYGVKVAYITFTSEENKRKLISFLFRENEKNRLEKKYPSLNSIQINKRERINNIEFMRLFEERLVDMHPQKLFKELWEEWKLLDN